jgi:uncharacterized protein YneF (UPF0154 family)
MLLKIMHTSLKNHPALREDQYEKFQSQMQTLNTSLFGMMSEFSSNPSIQSQIIKLLAISVERAREFTAKGLNDGL